MIKTSALWQCPWEKSRRDWLKTLWKWPIRMELIGWGQWAEGRVRDSPAAGSYWLTVHSAHLRPGHSPQPQLGILGHRLCFSFLIYGHQGTCHSGEKLAKSQPEYHGESHGLSLSLQPLLPNASVCCPPSASRVETSSTASEWDHRQRVRQWTPVK